MLWRGDVCQRGMEDIKKATGIAADGKPVSNMRRRQPAHGTEIQAVSRWSFLSAFCKSRSVAKPGLGM